MTGGELFGAAGEPRYAVPRLCHSTFFPPRIYVQAIKAPCPVELLQKGLLKVVQSLETHRNSSKLGPNLLELTLFWPQKGGVPRDRGGFLAAAACPQAIPANRHRISVEVFG